MIDGRLNGDDSKVLPVKVFSGSSTEKQNRTPEEA